MQDAKARSPTVPSPAPTALTPTLERNIEALRKRREEEKARARAEERIAEIIASFAGSMPFVYLHVGIYGFWIIANLGWVPGVMPWDRSFVVLAMIASVEAIFLSTFILIKQNRMARAESRRADLDLQISLLAEHEVTKLITMVEAIAKRLNVSTKIEHEVTETDARRRTRSLLDKLDRTGED